MSSSITTDPKPKRGEEKLNRVWQTLVDKQSSSGSTNEEEATEKREWPSYDYVMSNVVSADYNQVLQCPLDFLKRDDGEGKNVKTLSPHGVVCRARLELFSNDTNGSVSPNYTGVLAPGTSWDHCLLRLSSAMQPPTQAISSAWAKSIMYATGDKLRNAQLFPVSAIKVFLDDDDGNDENKTVPSKNLLFAGSKIGQREKDFFAHCQCTSMTERMPMAVKPFVRKFWQYSNYPLSLGVSDFCKPISDGTAEESKELPDLNFPFALIIKPRIHMTECDGDAEQVDDDGGSDDGEETTKEKCGGLRLDDDNAVDSNDVSAETGSGGGSSWSRLKKFTSFPSFGSSPASNTAEEKGSFDFFLDFCLNEIPVETHLYDVYACPTPQAVLDPSQLQRIGRIVTKSTFMKSSPDDGLFFKHQAKEEDYELRPDWPETLQQPVTSLDGGKVKGTIGTLVGWKLFQQQIDKKQFIDFEQPSSS